MTESAPARPARPARAAIIAVGSELLGSTRLDTNSLWLTERLEASGILPVRKACVGDDPGEIGCELKLALARADVVLVTGGLGPTDDDRTREGVAAALAIPLELDAELLETIRGRFASRGLSMPAINERQAHVLRGAQILQNPRGSAPGLWIEHEGRGIALLPGVPREMKGMFEKSVLPVISARWGGPGVHRRILKIAAAGESSIEERARPVYARWPGHEFTILASAGEVQIHLCAGGTEAEALRILDEQTRDFESALSGMIFGRDEQTLEGVVGDLLRQRGSTLAVAESCTGGGVGARITDVAGSSDYFAGGVISYSNAAKLKFLGVSAQTLASSGAVSEQSACEMAQGALREFETDFALSFTGIAGPGGGTPEKPAGTVWIALAERDGQTRTRLVSSPGGRAAVRAWAGATGLEMLRRRLAEDARG